MKKYYTLFSISVIIILGSLIYSNTFYCSFSFDDIHNIIDNPKIHNLFDIKSWWSYVPSRAICFFTFALNYYFNKTDVWGYHLFNLLIHLINALLIWQLMLATFSTPGVKNNRIAKFSAHCSLLAALLFVSHPVQTQAVTYIIQRLASLATLFYLLSLLLYVKARLISIQKANNKIHKHSVFLFAGSFISGILGMLTKEITFTLPFAIILYEFYFLQNKSFSLPSLRSLFSVKNYRLIAIVIFFLAIICIIPYHFSFKVFAPVPPQGGSNETITAATYLFTQFRVLVTYIRLMFLPINQALDYDYPLSYTLFDIKTIASLLFILFLIALAKILFKNYRLISFGILWFFLTSAVESSVIPIADVIFEHRTYPMSFGFFMALVSAAFYVFSYLKKDSPFNIKHSPFLYTFITLILIYSYLTYQRNKVWQDEYKLWADNIKKSPGKARVWYNYGRIVFIRDDSLTTALNAFNKAISLNKDYAGAYGERALVKQNLKDYNGAIADFNKTLELDSTLFITYYMRALVKETVNDLNGAIIDFKKAIQSGSNEAEFYFAIASPYFKLHDYSNAIFNLNKAISINPDHYRAYYSRALCREKLSDFRGAINDYAKAIAIKTDYIEAYFGKANNEFYLENYDDAIKDYSNIIQIKPDYVLAYKNRGVIKYRIKDLKGACEDWHAASGLGNKDAEQYIKSYCK